MKSLKYVIATLVLLIGMASNAQDKLFEVPKGYTLSKEGQKKVDLYKSKRNVTKVTLVKVNTKALQSSTVEISIEGNSMVATEIKRKVREGNDFSWFGRLEDGHGICFTVQGNDIMAKFPFHDTPYALYPVENGVHVLLTCQENADPDAHQCGNQFAPTTSDDSKDQNNENVEKALLNDNNCNYRILLVYTQAAETSIAMDLNQFSQNLADEANLAYILSGIALEAEIAKTMIVNHVESNVLVPWPTVPGSTVTEDLINLRNTGDGILEAVHTWRDIYRADVVFMVRELLCASNSGNNHGIAYDFNADATEAFAIGTAESLTLDRFTFTHEIGHLQGAYHDNQPAVPIYARGFVFSTNSTANRTLMSVGCAANDGCRIQQFSNPTIDFPPGSNTFTGVANQNDNALRLTETASVTTNYRVTSDNLVLQAETIANQTASNHLANFTITSNNASIVYSSGSRGTMRAGTSILWLPGMHCTSGSTVRAYIVTNPCENLPLFVQHGNNGSAMQNPSLDSEEAFTMLKLYPNPVSDQINVEFNLQDADANNAVVIDIIDSFGRLMLEHKEDVLLKGINKVTLDIESLPPGAYTCQVRTVASNRTKSFIVQ